MKKRPILIIILTLFTYLNCQASVILNNTFYTSKRFGLNTVGQEFSITFKDFKISTDFESFMEKYNGTFFTPSYIYYGTGIEYKNIGIMHYCLHDLDRKTSSSYPIRNKIYFQW